MLRWLVVGAALELPSSLTPAPHESAEVEPDDVAAALDEIALGTLRAAFKARSHKASDHGGTLLVNANRLGAVLQAVPGLGDALPGDVVLATQQVSVLGKRVVVVGGWGASLNPIGHSTAFMRCLGACFRMFECV